MKVLLSTLVLFFLFHSVRAQDTVKHIGKHIHKTHLSDSAKAAHSIHESRIKDTSKVRRSHAVILPKYPRDGYVAVTSGIGLPLAAFASDLGAATGSAFSISAAFPGVISHWGIALKFDYGINGFNKSRLEGIENTKTGFSNVNCTLSDTLGHCSYSAFLTGVYLTYPHKHYTIDIRVLVGAMISTIPALAINYTDETRGTSASSYQAQTSASAFAFGFGFEARYPVKPRFCVIASIDYLHAVPAFNVITTGATVTSYGSIVSGGDGGDEATTDHPFNLFNLSLGVGYTISAEKPHISKAD